MTDWYLVAALSRATDCEQQVSESHLGYVGTQHAWSLTTIEEFVKAPLMQNQGSLASSRSLSHSLLRLAVLLHGKSWDYFSRCQLNVAVNKKGPISGLNHKLQSQKKQNRKWGCWASAWFSAAKLTSRPERMVNMIRIFIHHVYVLWQGLRCTSLDSYP